MNILTARMHWLAGALRFVEVVAWRYPGWQDANGVEMQTGNVSVFSVFSTHHPLNQSLTKKSTYIYTKYFRLLLLLLTGCLCELKYIGDKAYKVWYRVRRGCDYHD